MKTSIALVTGADGFIGSHLVEMLLAQDVQVKALSHYNSFNFWGHLEHLAGYPGLSIHSGDIRDAEFIDQLVQGSDCIFHLASLIAIPYSYQAPASYIDVNVKGTLNICQSALKHKIAKVIHTSTSEVYGTAQYVPIDEKHPLSAQSPYSASKIAADALAMSYFHSFGLPLVIARPFNTFGPRQSARAIIPTMITQILAGKNEISLGDVSPTRDFTFVEDTCRALILLWKKAGLEGETLNIGTGKEISIKDLFQLITDISGKKIELKIDKERLRPENSEVMRLVCNFNKLKNKTGFEPNIELTDGLKKTWEWFGQPENLKKYKTGIYNV